MVRIEHDSMVIGACNCCNEYSAHYKISFINKSGRLKNSIAIRLCDDCYYALKMRIESLKE